jgi:hypothetical protein
MSNIGIYMFRHVRTAQVLVSWKRTMSPKNLEQLKVTQRPASLRKDLWKPLVAAIGLEAQTARGLCQSILRVPPSEVSDPEAFIKLPKKKREVQLLDQTDDKIAALCTVLTKWESKAKARGRNVPHVSLYWERMAYKDSVTKRGLSWPEFVSHHQMELRRGREIMGLPSSKSKASTQATAQPSS